jgi:dephospho-CoA kinase
MKCFIIIGMPAAGKDIARQFARLQGLPYFATGDIVRAEASRRGVSPDADSKYYSKHYAGGRSLL